MSDEQKTEKNEMTPMNIILGALLAICILVGGFKMVQEDSARDAATTIDAPVGEVGLVAMPVVIHELEPIELPTPKDDPLLSTAQPMPDKEGWIMLDMSRGVWIEWGNGKITLHNALAWDWEFNPEKEQYEFSYQEGK